ncbi:hypothetical protein AWV80_18520 [Cupriavidus sp. UYMU48A]|nr:hypothetical protein AWV80_18520 [Cupriavidus sp. UYMU48A]
MPVKMDVVAEAPFCRLLRFSAGEGRDVRRMLCAPLAGHRAAVVRDAIEAMLLDADVYVTDWTDARDVPPEAGPFGLADCVLLLEQFMTLLDPACLDVVAICQATVPSLAAVSRLASRDAPEVRALVLMGGPVDARLHPTRLGDIAAMMPVPVFLAHCTGAVPRGYRGAGRSVYPGFLQLPTLASGQPERLAAWCSMRWHIRGQGPCAARYRAAAIAGYAAMMDMPAEFVLDTMRIVFREHLLPRGLWCIGEVPVDPAAMRATRLLTVEGALDAITAPDRPTPRRRCAVVLKDVQVRRLPCRIVTTMGCSPALCGEAASIPCYGAGSMHRRSAVEPARGRFVEALVEAGQFAVGGVSYVDQRAISPSRLSRRNHHGKPSLHFILHHARRRRSRDARGVFARARPTVPRTKASTRRSVRTNLRPHLRDPRSSMRRSLICALSENGCQSPVPMRSGACCWPNVTP